METRAAIRSIGRRSVRAAAMTTAALRPLPDLVLIGVKRGGTTSLFRDLERNPSMCSLVPSARRLPLRENMKGVHFFDGDGSASMRWYRSHFATGITRSFRARRTGAAFTAEASPYYFFHPLAAQRAAQALPDTVFAVMLRDPVERTVSHWAEQSRNGVERLGLAEALAAESDRVGNDGDHLADGTLTESWAHEQQTYAAQSEYMESYDRWARLVGPERLIVLFSEHYYTDPTSTIATITDRLGVPPTPLTEETIHRNAASRPSALEPQLEARLIERFRPDVEQLSVRLGVTPPWPRFATSQ